MQMEEIMLELQEQGVIPYQMNTWKVLSGGTVSSVYALLLEDRPELVVKWNDPKSIQAESAYLRTYDGNPLFSQVIYVDAQHRYYVYTYQPGENQYPSIQKAEMLVTLVTMVINHVHVVGDSDGYGYVDEPSTSWKDFLLSRYQWAQQTIAERFTPTEHEYVEQLIQTTYSQAMPCLLHGDFGVHNFLFQQGELTGVIDPIPTIGEPLYDLIYAFCSSPDQLDTDTIQLAVERMDPKFILGRDLKSEVIIGLYFRIATCILHHPQDFEVYIEAWEYWNKRK
ncbi:aminoglycoside phosphotransferase family protein [Paenibacillus guangzhouensis]|uniref:aminoglycoside phosphotransferase family protein n=1 Tax=Paenibacillus guangzhouensis TaxID=1473112 RepID=UPI001266A637|nr:aminoglycoside phosphotransferase family protein [Paenibacillus guangzhouensis]